MNKEKQKNSSIKVILWVILIAFVFGSVMGITNRLVNTNNKEIKVEYSCSDGRYGIFWTSRNVIIDC